jgi:cob(I)alamin adenosyltransferase
LFDSKRVPKDSPRVEAYGTIDELNSAVGVAASICKDDFLSLRLRKIQDLLFVAGADLSTVTEPAKQVKNAKRITSDDVSRMESEIDEIYSKLPRLKNFILPTGTQLSAQLHIARAICRRAERRVVTASKTDTINPQMIPFLNRLSTYLFNLARLANQTEGEEDKIWAG